MRRKELENNYTIYGAMLLLIFCIGSGMVWLWGDFPTGITVAAFLSVLAVVATEDIAVREIADEYHVIILVLAGISCFTTSGLSLCSRAIGVVCVSVPLLAVALIAPGAFGGGDIKLMAVSGAFLGWRTTLVSAAIACFLGGFWGVYLMAVRKKGRKEQFAFGPFLCLGMAAGLLAGDWMISLIW